MGAFDNKQFKGPRWLTGTFGSLVGVLALLGSVTLASIAGANPADEMMRPVREAPAATTRTEAPEASVSMSPSALQAARRSSTSNALGSGSDDIPLTRAAAQQRVEEMSPVTWLSSYGPVSVGRTK